LIAPIALLAACQTAPVQPPLPRTVYVPVDRYVPLDASLLQPCPIEEPRSRLVSEAVRVANARKLALEACNADKAAIRAAQPAATSSISQPRH